MTSDSPTKIVGEGGERDQIDELAARLADEMMVRWQVGERPGAEEFLHKNPLLLNKPEAAIRLIYEEVCLRQESGEVVPPDEILKRFPLWRSQLEVLLDCHRLLDNPAPPEMPSVHDALGEFILLAELGRGIQGRVYLASQPTLSERLVVLKITPRTGQEHLTLARLQHTHIMPLYAVYDDPKRNLRTMCMPYFAGAALHHVLEELRAIPLQERTGQDLLEALDRAVARSTEQSVPHLSSSEDKTLLRSTPTAQPARQMFAGMNYVKSFCWIGACLADALEYAHERGLVHLDLKPSNVLLASDGQPMLLDFHIAQKPILPDGPLPEGLGGTPAYMSPEQQLAFKALREGEPVLVPVDGRTDLYSLGLLLYEALGGAFPLKESASVVPLQQCNPQVSAGLSDIIGKCLAVNSLQRYARAASLADDLRCYLHDLPLRGVRNRSLSENWQKWRRRRPHALALLVMTVAVLTAAISVGLMSWNRSQQQRRDVESALTEGRQSLENHAPAQAVEAFARALKLAEELPGGGNLNERIQAEMNLARHVLAAEQLHTLSDRLRFLYGANELPAGETSTLARHWRVLWDKRGWLKERPGVKLEPEMEQRLNADLLDLGMIWADLRVRWADPGQVKVAYREALQILADTEALFGPHHVLSRQRQIYAKNLGQTELEQAAARSAIELKPQTAWEHYALGRAFLLNNELVQASASFEKALDLQPHGFWPNFYQGICAYRQERFEEAVTAFRVCIALAPRSAECFYNRGLAHGALGRTEPALHDYDRALQLNPSLAAAALNRGLLHFAQHRHAEALSDLKHALKSGGDPASIHYNLALVHLDQHDRNAAVASLLQALQANTHHRAAQALLEQLQRR